MPPLSITSRRRVPSGNGANRSIRNDARISVGRPKRGIGVIHIGREVLLGLKQWIMSLCDPIFGEMFVFYSLWLLTRITAISCSPVNGLYSGCGNSARTGLAATPMLLATSDPARTNVWLAAIKWCRSSRMQLAAVRTWVAWMMVPLQKRPFGSVMATWEGTWPMVAATPLCSECTTSAARATINMVEDERNTLFPMAL